MRFRIMVDRRRMVEHALSNITRPTRYVQYLLSSRVGAIRSDARVQSSHEMIFPHTVDAEGHEIVHGVVVGGDGGEDCTNSRGFERFGDSLVAEVGGFVVLGRRRLLLSLQEGGSEGAAVALVTYPWRGDLLC